MNLIKTASLASRLAHPSSSSVRPHSVSAQTSQPPLSVSISRSNGLQAFCGGQTRLALERDALSFCGEKRAASSLSPGPSLHCRADLPDLVGIAPATAVVYGASLLGGGLFAFTRTGSKGSLGGGVSGGVALGVAFFLMQVPETQDLGNAIGFGASLLFASVFGIRLAATGKPIPSGVLLGVSALATIIFANAYFQTRL